MTEGMAKLLIFVVIWAIILFFRSVFSSSKSDVLKHQNDYSRDEHNDNNPIEVSSSRCKYCGTEYVDNEICPSCGSKICRVCRRCDCK